MELRSFNVTKLYSDIVKCRIQNDLGVYKNKLDKHAEDIKDMISQIYRNEESENIAMCCGVRLDQEVWTQYLQIVEMLLLLGLKLNYLTFDGVLTEKTIIKFNV